MYQSAKMENEEIESDETSSDEEKSTNTAEHLREEPSELNVAQWSVVSFEKTIARNLTYAEAAENLKELDAQKIAGLCIITDEAAERLD